VYFGVDKAKEPHLVGTVRLAVNAPLPSDWQELEDGDEPGFLHRSGVRSKQHPLDAYFLHRIRLERHEHIKQQQRLRNHKHSTKMTVEEAVERDEQMAAIDNILANYTDEYACMGLSRGCCSKADIRSRYRALALLCHPDKSSSDKAHTAFQVLTAAFRKISINMK